MSSHSMYFLLACVFLSVYSSISIFFGYREARKKVIYWSIVDAFIYLFLVWFLLFGGFDMYKDEVAAIGCFCVSLLAWRKSRLIPSPDKPAP